MPNRRAISEAGIGSARYSAATCASETLGGSCPGRPAAVSHPDTVCGCTWYIAANSPRESRSFSRRRRSSAVGGDGFCILPGRRTPVRAPAGRIGMLSSSSHVRTRCVVASSRAATAATDKFSFTYSCRSRSAVGRCTGANAPRRQRTPGSVVQRRRRRRDPGHDGHGEAVAWISSCITAKVDTGNSCGTGMLAGDVGDQNSFGVLDVLCNELLVCIRSCGDQLEQYTDVVCSGGLVWKGHAAPDDTFDIGQYLGHVRLNACADAAVVLVVHQIGRTVPFAAEAIDSGEQSTEPPVQQSPVPARDVQPAIFQVVATYPEGIERFQGQTRWFRV